MRALCVMALLGLAACGADGEPITPVARADISISNGGVHAHSRVGVSQGPWTVTLGF